MVTFSKPKERFVRFDGACLYLRIDGHERKLGNVTTRKGGLTREQKLRAVAANGEWVRL